MATEKVGIYRSYYGPVPTDKSGQPLPQDEWPKKRAHSWVVRWFGQDGNRYSKSFKVRKEAEWFAETKQPDVREGKADPPREISIEDFAKEHGSLMKGQISHNTLREQLRVLAYLQKIVGNRPLHRIRPQDAEMYVKCRNETGVSACTINKEITTLRRIFTLAADRRGYLPEGQNPFNKVKKRKVSRKPLRYISGEEFGLLLKAAGTSKWKVFLSLLYTTALRLDEACNLTWGDVDFERAVLRVAAKRDSKVTVPWEPKDHELRQIPLSKEMVNLLAEWQSQGPDAVPYVFMTKARYEYTAQELAKGLWHEGRSLLNNVLRGFKVIRRRAGVASCTLHDFRRSCITNWARAIPAHVVRVLAGHSSLETTMRFYLAVQEEDLAKARDVQSSVLKTSGTDQLMTNSAEKGSFQGHRVETGGT